MIVRHGHGSAGVDDGKFSADGDHDFVVRIVWICHVGKTVDGFTSKHDRARLTEAQLSAEKWEDAALEGLEPCDRARVHAVTVEVPVHELRPFASGFMVA